MKQNIDQWKQHDVIRSQRFSVLPYVQQQQQTTAFCLNNLDYSSWTLHTPLASACVYACWIKTNFITRCEWNHVHKYDAKAHQYSIDLLVGIGFDLLVRWNKNYRWYLENGMFFSVYVCAHRATSQSIYFSHFFPVSFSLFLANTSLADHTSLKRFNHAKFTIF